MCSSDAPDPPNYTALAQASEYAADLAFAAFNEQLDFARSNDTRNRQVLNRVLDTVLPIQEDTAAQARQDRQYLIDTFRPLELAAVQDAQNFNTQENKDREAAAAASDVAQTFAQARKASEDRLKSFGIDPSQGAFAALQSGSAIEQAQAQAGAARQARNRVEDIGRTIRSDAINLGRGLPSSIAGAFGTAINAGNSAVGNSVNVTNAGANAFGTATRTLGFANQSIGQGINALNTGFQNELSAANFEQQGINALAGGLGTAAGLGASFLADGGVVSGMIKGPGDGSGIDDAIVTKAEPGTFIIPKDVVDAVGTDVLKKLNKKKKKGAGKKKKAGKALPVAVSSGEFAVHPQAVKAVGVGALQKLVDELHTPAVIQKAGGR